MNNLNPPSTKILRYKPLYKSLKDLYVKHKYSVTDGFYHQHLRLYESLRIHGLAKRKTISSKLNIYQYSISFNGLRALRAKEFADIRSNAHTTLNMGFLTVVPYIASLYFHQSNLYLSIIILILTILISFNIMRRAKGSIIKLVQNQVYNQLYIPIVSVLPSILFIVISIINILQNLAK